MIEDPQFRAEMDYCGPRGLAWSEFLSWDQASRDAALLWQRHENERCTGCGTHPDDWDPARGGHERAFVATTVDCPGCDVLELGKLGHLKRRLDDPAHPARRPGLKRQVPRRFDADPGNGDGAAAVP